MDLRRSLPLSLGFAATGVGVALPGALLPTLIARWHLGDEQGGRLFLMAWVGSSLGSLAVRGSLRNTLCVGGLSVALAAAGLGLSTSGGWLTLCWMLLYGAGLGMTMTSISLIRQQQAVQVGQELVRLNLLWAAGALACPALTVRILTGSRLGPLLFGLAACFAALGLWAAWLGSELVHAAADLRWQPWKIFGRVPPGLVFMTMLITGVEASAGGWLATYAERGGHGVAAIIAAPTCFWAGLLLSRFYWSVAQSALRAQTIVRGSLALMVCASILLVATSSAWLALVAAFLLGFGIGPTYPLLLAAALAFDRSGAIFFLAGVGASLLPWLTGVVSTSRGSLRTGLLVPLAGSLLMLMIALRRGEAVEAS